MRTNYGIHTAHTGTNPLVYCMTWESLLLIKFYVWYGTVPYRTYVLIMPCLCILQYIILLFTTVLVRYLEWRNYHNFEGEGTRFLRR
jgi:hypothetical protein